MVCPPCTATEAYKHTHTHTYTHIRIHTHTHIRIHTHIHTHMHIYTYIQHFNFSSTSLQLHFTSFTSTSLHFTSLQLHSKTSRYVTTSHQNYHQNVFIVEFLRLWPAFEQMSQLVACDGVLQMDRCLTQTRSHVVARKQIAILQVRLRYHMTSHHQHH